jgi:RHS repeat-associated protein
MVKPFNDIFGAGVWIEYNAANQISRARDTRDGNIWRTYLHDARGNVIDNDRLTFTYDRSDQPVAMGGAVSATYAYDAHNRRVKQVIDGETIYSVYGTGGDLLYRDNITTGEETINLTLGSRPVARLITQGGITTPTYLYPDHLGTASLAANASGYITWWESYTPFGETLNNAPQGFNQPGFTGHIRDTATGLNYMQARYYDPVIGRFLSNDPVGFVSGGPGYFNRYAYTGNDPINRMDPNGEFWHIVGAGALGGVVGTLVNAGVQYAATGEVNVGDALAAGAGAAAASAIIAANPAMAANPATMAALGAVTSAGASVGGDVVNGRSVDAAGALVSGVAGAIAVPGGAKIGDAAENFFGAGANSIVGEVGGAALGEGVAAAIDAAVPVLSDGVEAGARAISDGAQAAGRSIDRAMQELTDPDNYPGASPEG